MSTEKTDLDSLVLQTGEVSATPTANTILDRLKSIQANTLISPAKQVSTVGANFTRPNNVTPYVANSVESTTSGFNMSFITTLPTGSFFKITSLKCSYVNATAIAGMNNRRLHLFSANPVVVVDGGAMTFSATEYSTYLGFINMNQLPIDVGTELYDQYLAVNFTGKLITSTIFGRVETVGAYTPVAILLEKFEITAEVC